MSVEIFPIRLGIDTCYVLRADGVIAVDAGPPNHLKKFLSGLERVSVEPEDVQLIVLTHGHWDHIGSAADTKGATNTKLVMHERDIEWLEKGLMPHPPGVTAWGRVLSSIAKVLVPLIKFPPAKVDFALTDEGMSLSEFGIPGRVIHTPGHTSGSVSVLLDSGEAFVGDLAMDGPPLRLSPGLPVLAEDPGVVVESWKLLLDSGAQQIFPAHGKPFPADVMRRAISS